MRFELIKGEFVFIIFISALIFFNLHSSSKQTLLSLIFMSIFGIVIYMYLSNLSESREKNNINNNDFFNNEIKNRHETYSDNFFINKFPKMKLKFFLKNKELVKIAKDIVITRMFDKAKYADILNIMNEYQKVYTYILGERYEIQSHVSIFIDLGKNILENLYSLYFVVPEKLRHVYGLDTYHIIQKNIEKFNKLNYKMLKVLKSFAMKQNKLPYFPDIEVMPVDKPFNYINNRKLP